MNFSQSWSQLNKVETNNTNLKRSSKPVILTGLGKLIFLGIAFAGFSFFCYLISDLPQVDWVIDKIVHNFYSQ